MSEWEYENWTWFAEYRAEEAMLIRSTLHYKSDILRDDGWIPFPQSVCSYWFYRGPGYAENAPSLQDQFPLPVGLLIELWENHEIFTGSCEMCGGGVYAIGFGGLLHRGGIYGCCVKCDGWLIRLVGGFYTMHNIVKSCLMTSKYEIGGGVIGGVVVGPRRPLVAMLKQFGENELPGDDWVTIKHISVERVTVRLDD